MINTKFWSDSWIRQKLNPLDRYLFLYFLTNEHTNICGIYELPIDIISFESGLDQHDLNKSLLPRLKPKIIYKDNWVIIPNFPNYQNYKENPKVKKGIEIALNNIPKEIIDYAVKNGYPIYTLSIPYIYPVVNSNSNSNLNSNSNSKEAKRSFATNNLIELFKNINPSYERLFSNKTQRSALERMIKKYGSEKMEKIINSLEITNSKKYAPTITTPLQLENKLGDLIAYIKKEADNKNKIAIL